MRSWQQWIPAGTLGLGCILLGGVSRQQAVGLRQPLETIARVIDGYRGVDQAISADEQRVAGMDNYLLRFYTRDSLAAFSLYVGYYQQQTQGRTIHSPKNCLPGAGWEPLSSGPVAVRSGGKSYTVNRYLLANGSARALVYYWYQGRGRVENSEYRVKWELMRDAALTGRTEEALVRIVVPLTGPTPAADSLAERVAAEIIPSVRAHLPVAARLRTHGA